MIDTGKVVDNTAAGRRAILCRVQVAVWRVGQRMTHEQIIVTPDDKEVLVTFEDRRWIFPLGDCVLLPLANTTAELIADYIATELLKRFKAKGITQLDELVVAVDENEGQWGVVTRTGDDLSVEGVQDH